MFVAPPELLRVKKTAEPILADVSADTFMLRRGKKMLPMVCLSKQRQYCQTRR